MGWLTLWIQLARLQFPSNMLPTNIQVHLFSHCIAAEPQCGSYRKVQSSGRKNKVTCRAEGGFAGQSVRGNAFPFTKPATVENPKWMGQRPGSPCWVPGSLELTPLRTATYWPLGSPREGEKRGETHAPCFVLTASQTLGTNSQPQNWLVFHQKHVNTGQHG